MTGEVIKGQFVDTTQQAGTNSGDTQAWTAWTVRHLPEMRVLQAAGVLGREGGDWRNVTEHSLVVNAVAMTIGQALEQAAAPVDMETLDRASILHDATKRLDKEKGVSYADEHELSVREVFLRKHGCSPEVIEASGYTGRVAEIYLDEAEQDEEIAGLPLVHLVIAYADARVRNTDVVPLEVARDKNKLKVPADADFYDDWYKFYKKVEGRLGESTGPDFSPADVTSESVVAMVRQAAASQSAA